MDFVNRLGIAALATPSMAPDGTPLVVLIAKASFDLPALGQPAQPAQEQPPVREVDEFEAEPGMSPPRYEAETVPHKPRCDVLLNGSAYAPEGTRVAGLRVGLRVGSMQKSFEVWGKRYWQQARAGRPNWSLSNAEPFDRLPLSYALAYGGRCGGADPAADGHVWEANPAGIGFYSRQGQAPIHACAAQTQRPGQGPADPWAPQASLSLGPVGRNWQPRLRYAGTLDDHWKQERFPLLPEDFDPLHWQSAPADQQLDALMPGMPVELWNLTPEGYRAFELPALELMARCQRAGKPSVRPLRMDTLLLEPDLGRFSMIWRTHWPVARGEAAIERIELQHA